MIYSMIRRGIRASIQMLLPVVLIIGIFPASVDYPVYPIRWTGLVPSNHPTKPKSARSALIVSPNPDRGPIWLRYLTRLVGDDWLGADWMYIGLGEYRYPALDDNGQQLYVTNPHTGVKTPQWNYTRFWVDPGPALLSMSDTLWVWGFDAGSHTVYADNILVDPPTRMAPPDDVSAVGNVLAVSGQTITIQDPGGIRSSVTVDPYTTYSFPNGEGLPRPKDGIWLSVSWLSGPAGLLGRYDGFHGDYRGILRLDFSQP